jgi:hypothetical protein
MSKVVIFTLRLNDTCIKISTLHNKVYFRLSSNTCRSHSDPIMYSFFPNDIPDTSEGMGKSVTASDSIYIVQCKNPCVADSISYLCNLLKTNKN